MTAAEIIALKTAIRNEMIRRSGYGSLSTNSGYGYADRNQSINYSSSSYNFSQTPVDGNPILTEHGQKTVDLLLNINQVGNLERVEQK